MDFGIEKEPETDLNTPLQGPDSYLQCVNGELRLLEPPSREPELRFVVWDESAPAPTCEQIERATAGPGNSEDPDDDGPFNVHFIFTEQPPDDFAPRDPMSRHADLLGPILMAKGLEGVEPITTDNGDGTFTHQFGEDSEWPAVISLDRWEVVSDGKGRDEMHHVQWAQKQKYGFFQIAHYPQKHMADGHARRLNDAGTKPWEFDGWYQ